MPPSIMRVLSSRRTLNTATIHLRPPHSISALSTIAASATDPFSAHPSHHRLSSVTTKSNLLKSYTVAPPIKPWPKTLGPKRLISIINRQQNLDLALQIFHFAGNFHPNFTHSFFTYLSIISRLAQARQFHHVETLLAQLRSSRINCSEILFIKLIRFYGLASRPKDAVRAFLRVPDFGATRTARSLNCLLNALVQNKRYDWVHTLFKNCRKGFGVMPNVFTCNILVRALCKSGDMKGAVKVLDEMHGLGFAPNVVSYTTLLGGYVQGGDMNGAKSAFGEILARGWVPDATTYTILMDGYCKSGRLIDAVKLMDAMEENGVKPNEVTYGVMIEAYCREKKPGEALNLLSDMLENKYVPSSVLSCKVVDVLCEQGKAEDACALWRMLLRKNVTPDNTISSTLIHWLCKEGNIGDAKKLFDEFERSSVPSVLTYNTLIAGMCDNGELWEAGRLWDDMVDNGCAPNAFTYNMLIKGFCKVGKPDEGVRVLREMLEKRCAPNESTYSILIDGLSDSGSGDKIMELLILVTSTGGKIDARSWRVILSKAIGNVDTVVMLDDIILKSNT